MGLKELERRAGNQQEGPTTFLKSNVYAIVKCLDVLKELNNVMTRDRKEIGSALTEAVGQHLKGIQASLYTSLYISIHPHTSLDILINP